MVGKHIALPPEFSWNLQSFPQQTVFPLTMQKRAPTKSAIFRNLSETCTFPISARSLKQGFPTDLPKHIRPLQLIDLAKVLHVTISVTIAVKHAVESWIASVLLIKELCLLIPIPGAHHAKRIPGFDSLSFL